MVAYSENSICAWDENATHSIRMPSFIRNKLEGHVREGVALADKYPESSIWIIYPENSEEILIKNLIIKILNGLSSDLSNTWLLYDKNTNLRSKFIPEGTVVLRETIHGYPITQDMHIEYYHTVAVPISSKEQIVEIGLKSSNFEISDTNIFLSENVMINFTEYSMNIVCLNILLKDFIVNNIGKEKYGKLHLRKPVEICETGEMNFYLGNLN